MCFEEYPIYELLSFLLSSCRSADITCLMFSEYTEVKEKLAVNISTESLEMTSANTLARKKESL